MDRTLVLGLGNILLGDEGVGVRVVERLQACYDFPEDVQVLDGGTLGLDLLPYVQDADRVLILDAVEMGAEPGALIRMEGDEVPVFLGVKISPHQLGLADLMAVSRLQGSFPSALVLWGVQPARIAVGIDLSPAVAAQVDVLADKAVAELRQWGIECTRKVEQKKEGESLCN